MRDPFFFLQMNLCFLFQKITPLSHMFSLEIVIDFHDKRFVRIKMSHIKKKSSQYFQQRNALQSFPCLTRLEGPNDAEMKAHTV